MNYTINPNFNIDCGFEVNSQHIESVLSTTNLFLKTIPSNVYKNVDYKTTSSIIGAIFCHSIADVTGAMVNPIEKGHPDVIPKLADHPSEELLRNYPMGLEVKCTIGNTRQGANLRAGQPRIDCLEGITWTSSSSRGQKTSGISMGLY